MRIHSQIRTLGLALTISSSNMLCRVGFGGSLLNNRKWLQYHGLGTGLVMVLLATAIGLCIHNSENSAKFVRHNWHIIQTVSPIRVSLDIHA